MIVLHVGAPKTGSTSIQQFITSNRAGLEDAGIHAPEAGWVDGAGHTGFRRSFEPTRAPQFAEVQSELTKTFNEQKNVLISSELLWTVKPTRLLDKYPSLDGCKVVFFLRDQRTMIESHYSQKIKGGRSLPTPEKFIQEQRKFYDFNRFCESWSAVFGRENLKPLIYEDACKAGLIRTFFETVASLMSDEANDINSASAALLDEQKSRPEISVNRRLSATQLQLLYAVNRLKLDPDVKKEIQISIKRDKQLGVQFGGSFDLFSEDIRHSIEEIYDAGNAKIKANFFPALTRERLFPSLSV